jgi:hypothetical protein
MLLRNTCCSWASRIVAASLFFAAGPAEGQLVVTEMLVNPVDDTIWEYIEIKNTGATPIDLNGYIAAKLNETADTDPDILDTVAENTIVPAGGVAVLYPGNPNDFDDSVFRQAWQLSPSVPVIAVSGFEPLSNSGTGRNFAYFDPASYDAAIAASGGIIADFTLASFGLSYVGGFPTVSNITGTNRRESMEWNGTGDYRDGTNWRLITDTAAGAPGGITSQPAFAAIDTANPGQIPTPGSVPGTMPASLFFSEIMYNPGSSEPANEWVEVHNNSGFDIDFGLNPAVFDDGADALRTAANLTSGVIPNGTTAVIYNGTTGATTESLFENSWGVGINLIPVTGAAAAWPSLNQSGDQIGIWSSLETYTNSGRDFSQTIATLVFDDDTPGNPPNDPDIAPGDWPQDDGDASIHLVNYNDVLDGGSWALAAIGDGFGSRRGEAVIHVGGDVGLPGFFGTTPTPADADFDNDGDVDGADFLTWQRGLGAGSAATGDANGDGQVNGLDLTEWRNNFGAAAVTAGSVPEPGSLALLGVGVAVVLWTGRRRG